MTIFKAGDRVRNDKVKPKRYNGSVERIKHDARGQVRYILVEWPSPDGRIWEIPRLLKRI